MAITWQVGDLGNNLRLVTTPVPTAQSVAVCIFIGVGSRMEDRPINGISHYLEHMLFKGSASRPSTLDISQAIEGAGGVLNAYTNRELTCYWTQVPYDYAALAVDVLGDMATRPLLQPEEIDKERFVIFQEIRRSHDQPAAWAGELLSRALFGDQPIGWPIAGTEESVGAVTRQDLVDHVALWHVPDSVVVAVAGNIEHEQVMSLVEQKLGSMGHSRPPSFQPAVHELPEERIQVESRQTDQNNLAIGLRALARNDPGRFTLAILNSILGRGMSSRLFKEVREKRGLAYSVGSSTSRHYDTGALAVSAGVGADKIEEACKVIVDELLKLTAEPVPDDELTRARDYTVGNFRLGLETTMALAQYTGEDLLTLGKIEDVDDVVARLRSVTPDDIKEMAKRLIAVDRIAMSAVGPQASTDVLGKALSR
jgi:predicted Zn-dependent peptidase